MKSSSRLIPTQARISSALCKSCNDISQIRCLFLIDPLRRHRIKYTHVNPVVDEHPEIAVGGRYHGAVVEIHCRANEFRSDSKAISLCRRAREEEHSERMDKSGSWHNICRRSSCGSVSTGRRCVSKLLGASTNDGEECRLSSSSVEGNLKRKLGCGYCGERLALTDLASSKMTALPVS